MIHLFNFNANGSTRRKHTDTRFTKNFQQRTVCKFSNYMRRDISTLKQVVSDGRGVSDNQTPQRPERKDSPLRSLEHVAGVSLEGLSLQMLTNPLTLGIAAGLFVGKQVGVFLPLWVGLKARWFSMPDGANLLMLYGTAIATGIGFTMSFFIGSLAYQDLDPALADAMKLGVLGGSLLSLLLAILVLRVSTFKRFSAPPSATTV